MELGRFVYFDDITLYASTHKRLTVHNSYVYHGSNSKYIYSNHIQGKENKFASWHYRQKASPLDAAFCGVNCRLARLNFKGRSFGHILWPSKFNWSRFAYIIIIIFPSNSNINWKKVEGKVISRMERAELAPIIFSDESLATSLDVLGLSHRLIHSMEKYTI